MKLLYIHQYFTFPQGSAGTRSYDLSKAFINKGIDVTMVTTSASLGNTELDEKKRWTYMERENIKFWILRCPYNQKMSIPRRILSFFQFIWFASFKCLSIKADMVLATSTPLTIAIPAMIKKMISRTPYIFEIRDVWPEGPIQLGYVKNKFLIRALRWMEKLIYNRASHLVVLSTGMKDCIMSRIKKLPPIEVIPNISEINRFADITQKVDLNMDFSNKRVILYAGTMGPVNRIIYVAELAKALKELGIDDIVFLIVGDGNQKDYIVNYCVEYNLLNVNMFFGGKVPKNTLPYLYNIAILGSSFVLDKKIKWDNSANKFFDTLAAGKPILINHRGWQADLIEKENCGYVLPAELNKEAVLSFISYIHNDEVLKLQGENAKRVAIEQFSLEVAVGKYQKIFSKF